MNGFIKIKMLWILLLVVVVGIALAAGPVYGAFKHGYAWQEMDWNEDGRTTIREFLRSANIGKRRVNLGGRTCDEYYSFKDGLTVRAICSSQSA
jgi:hypothetical protein